MTIPTIGELKGNTILQLFADGYNKLKNAILGKQDTLTAGYNIVISDDNVISAVEGGSLEDYYTKEETDALVDVKADSDDVYTKEETYTSTEIDSLVDAKADSDDVYTKTEVDTLLENNGYKLINTITPIIVGENNQPQHIEISGLQDGDIIDINISSVEYNFGNGTLIHSGMFVFKTTNTEKVCNSTLINTFMNGSAQYLGIFTSGIVQSYSNDTLSLTISGNMFYERNDSSTYMHGNVVDTQATNIVINSFNVLRRS